ncbi:MAG: hypothetical protein M3Z36_04585 [Acidobacteriota bacterium]|nr:hypothetical protein [Acidobacteriota bacterium]
MLPSAFERYFKVLYWVLPSGLCLWLYWYCLKGWFLYDDFLWVGLRNGLESWHDWWTAIFAPTIHGTFRPLSERAYFLIFRALFDLDALPYRIWVFATFFADLILFSSITRRLTRSDVAGFFAPIFWFVHAMMFTALGWSSAYMQVLCGFFLLLAFHFLLRFAETGRLRYYWWQWAAFLIGFGAMETNLVYPALAASYAILCAPSLLRKILPLFVPSIIFAAAHMMLAPKQTTGPYSLHFDANLPFTFWSYWTMALKSPWGIAAAVLWTGALLGFTLCQLCRRKRLPLVFLSWFAILLAPVLPLRDHVSGYYLTLPLMGLAMLGAYALASAWQNALFYKIAGTMLACAYLLANVPAARAASKWISNLGRDVRTMVLGIRTAHELHPGKAILISGVDTGMFWAGISEHPFRAIGVPDVYLTPESEQKIGNVDKIEDYIYPAALTARGLARDEIEVYRIGHDRPRNITQEYEKTQGPRLDRSPPRRVIVTQLHAQDQLGTGWYPIEGTLRWTSQRATLTLGGPTAPGQKLHVTAYCNSVQLKDGPLTMNLTIAGKPLPPAVIRNCDDLEFQFPLPAELIGQPAVEIGIAADRPSHVPNDDREFGFAFGMFEIK